LVRWPAVVQPGSIEDAMALNIDFAPTLLELAGVPVPLTMQGRSLKPLMLGETPDQWRTSMYYRYYEYDPKFPWSDVQPHLGIRTETHKLIWYHTFDAWELYDLTDDNGEMHNLYYDPAYADVADQLSNELKNLQKQVGDLSPLKK
jgi:arylsulfatase A-like enzyme